MGLSSVQLNKATGTDGAKIATDKDDSGFDHQKALLEFLKANVSTPVTSVDPLPVTAPVPLLAEEWIQAVREGKITSYSAVNQQGYTAGLGATYQTLWGDTSLVNVGLLTTPATVKLASTDANDGIAGTGALTVLISGLNPEGAEQTEVVILTGQTEVVTNSTWKAINSMVVLTVGTLRGNAGTIWCGNGTFTAGVPAVKYNLIETGFTLSKAGIYTVPTGKQVLIWSAIFMVASTNKFVDVRARVDDGVIDRVVAPFELGQGDFVARSPGAAAVTAGQMLKWEGKVDTGTAAFSLLTTLVVKDA